MAVRALPARLRRARALRFYRRFVPRDGLCFDIGANMGNRTELFLALGAKVVAVEPQAICIEALSAQFGDSITLVEGVAGPTLGEAELLVASYHTLATVSREWTERVQASGRFSEFSWNETRRVPMTTLDALVDEHGVPDFCKIDVEGFEREVIEGLSRSLPAVSIEFDVEHRAPRLEALERLHTLGLTRFNYSHGESLRFELSRWTDLAGIREFLLSPVHTVDTFGDVYAMS
jgi:FkbM family methyltransferase